MDHRTALQPIDRGEIKYRGGHLGQIVPPGFCLHSLSRLNKQHDDASEHPENVEQPQSCFEHAALQIVCCFQYALVVREGQSQAM